MALPLFRSSPFVVPLAALRHALPCARPSSIGFQPHTAHCVRPIAASVGFVVFCVDRSRGLVVSIGLVVPSVASFGLDWSICCIDWPVASVGLFVRSAASIGLWHLLIPSIDVFAWVSSVVLLHRLGFVDRSLASGGLIDTGPRRLSASHWSIYLLYPSSVGLGGQAAPSEELSDEVKAAIVKQVEFYFSDENLQTDVFMQTKMKAGGTQGEAPFVPQPPLCTPHRTTLLCNHRCPRHCAHHCTHHCYPLNHAHHYTLDLLRTPIILPKPLYTRVDRALVRLYRVTHRLQRRPA